MKDVYFMQSSDYLMDANMLTSKRRNGNRQTSIEQAVRMEMSAVKCSG